MSKKTKRKRILLIVLLEAIYGLAMFTFGSAVIQYHLVPDSLLLENEANDTLPSEVTTTENEEYAGEWELLRFAFTDQLIGPQLYPPVDSFDEIHERINEMMLPVSLFQEAYSLSKIVETNLDDHIFSLDYRLDDDLYTAYSFYRKADNSSTHQCAVLIIPGTGWNQATGIFYVYPNNPHGNILEITSSYCDSFVFVKPNEDFLAIHNGDKKLTYQFIINDLLNKGGSYSAHYIANSLAITKYLKDSYPEVYVVGLSQGAEATLLTSLQSEPTGTIVASGFSVINDKINWSLISQIVIPGIYRDYSMNYIRKTITESETNYLFTYGKQEVGIYKVDALENATCNFFKGISNVRCVIHEGGHIFPAEHVEDFLSSQLAQ